MVYFVPNVIPSLFEYIITSKRNKIEENIVQEFRLKNINKTGNYFFEETNQKYLMSKNLKLWK